MAEYRTKTQCNAIRELSEACADEYSTRERWRKKKFKWSSEGNLSSARAKQRQQKIQ